MALPLQAVLPSRLAREADIDLVDARRIISRVHRDGALPSRAPATIRRVALESARRLGHVPTLEVLERLHSRQDPFVKYAFRAEDGAVFESVRIPLERAGRFAVCVSSQVGCGLACAFCATGRMGLRRNLEPWEIIEQVRIIRRELPEAGRVHGVLFQGMGEPLANVERVVEAIRVMGEPSALAIDLRNITVCTAGLPAGIRRLMTDVPQVRLGLSMGSARPSERRRLMPIDVKHSLDEVLDAVAEHALRTKISPMWAYTLLADQNDAEVDANALADRAQAFVDRTEIRPRISLIPFNAVDGAGFRRTAGDRQDRFRAVLRARGFGSILRYSGGGDVGAACGQLARRQDTPKSLAIRGLDQARGAG